MRHCWIAAVAGLAFASWQVRNAEGPHPKDEWIDIEVTVRAYCPCSRCCGRYADGRYCTGRKIDRQDYSFAVSPDLEAYLPINRTRLHIPGYNGPGRMSVCRDRTRSDRYRQIEVLMTVPKRYGRRILSPHARAFLWGHKKMTIRVRKNP